jgi:hypothetical protein
MLLGFIDSISARINSLKRISISHGISALLNSFFLKGKEKTIGGILSIPDLR